MTDVNRSYLKANLEEVSKELDRPTKMFAFFEQIVEERGPERVEMLAELRACSNALKRAKNLLAILAASAMLAGCYSAHEPAEPVAHHTMLEVMLYDDAQGERVFWAGAEFEGETVVLGDHVLSDPLGCDYTIDLEAHEVLPGSCTLWDGTDATWTSGTVQPEQGIAVQLEARVGAQPDERGRSMLAVYTLRTVSP